MKTMNELKREILDEFDCSLADAGWLSRLIHGYIRSDNTDANIHDTIDELVELYHAFLVGNSSLNFPNIAREYNFLLSFTTKLAFQQWPFIPEQQLTLVDEKTREFINFISRLGHCPVQNGSAVTLPLNIFSAQFIDERAEGYYQDYCDENWKRRFETPLRTYFTCLQPFEMTRICSYLDYGLKENAPLDTQKTAAGLFVLMLTACQEKKLEKLTIYSDAGSQLGLCLKKGVWRRHDFRPNKAAKIPEGTDGVYVTNTHIVELPLPQVLVSSCKRLMTELGKDCFSLSYLLPKSAKSLWDVLKHFSSSGEIVSQRTGWEAFRLPMFQALASQSDNDVASLILGQTEFSSRHHQYYLSQKVSESIRVWKKAVTCLFVGVLVEFEGVQSWMSIEGHYHGSEVMLCSDFLHSHHNNVQKRINSLWKRRYYLNENELAEMLELAACITGAALSTNFSFRDRKELPIPKEVFDVDDGALITIIDKKVTKKCPERVIPFTTFSHRAIRSYQVLKRFVCERLKPAAKSVEGLGYLTQGKKWKALGSKKILRVLYPGVKLPGNVYRQMNACEIRQVGAGTFGVNFLGHESDNYRIHSPYSLSSPLQFQGAIEKIQSEQLKLPTLPSKFSYAKTGHENLIQSSYDRQINHLLANCLPPHLNVSQAIDAIENAPVQSMCGANWLTLNDGTRWFINDELCVLINAYQKLIEKPIIKASSGLKNLDCPELVQHFDTYLRECKPLPKGLLESLLANDTQRRHNVIVPPGKRANRTGLPALSELRKKLSAADGVTNHVRIIREHLSQEMELDGIPVLSELLNLAFSHLPMLDAYCYTLLADLVQETKNKQKGIRASTIETYYSRIIPDIYDYFSNIDFECVLDEPGRYFDEFVSEIQRKCIAEADYREKGTSFNERLRLTKRFFNILKPGLFHQYGNNKATTLSVTAHIVTEAQFRQLLDDVNAQTHLSNEKKLRLRCFYLLQFRFGLRSSEAEHLLAKDFYGVAELFYVHSTNKNRVKSLASNRFIPVDDTICRNDLETIRALRHEAERQSGQGILVGDYLDVNYARKLLKASTGNPQVRLHDLRHSFANYHYLMLTGTDLAFVRDYFWCESIIQYRDKFLERHVVGGKANSQAALYVLADLMGHSHPHVTMRSYIHVAELAYAFHTKEANLLRQKDIATLAGIKCANSYTKKRGRNNKNGYLSGLAGGFSICSNQNDRGCQDEGLECEDKLVLLTKDTISRLRRKLTDRTLSDDELVMMKQVGLLNRNNCPRYADILVQLEHGWVFDDSIVLGQIAHETLECIIRDWSTRISYDCRIAITGVRDSDSKLLSGLDLYYSYRTNDFRKRGCSRPLTWNARLALLLFIQLLMNEKGEKRFRY